MAADSDKKVIGYRQSIACINECRVSVAYIADDVEKAMKDELISLLREKGVSFELVPTKRELGKLHGIKVGASIVCILN